MLWAVGLRSGNLLENPFESLPSGTTVMWFVVGCIIAVVATVSEAQHDKPAPQVGIKAPQAGIKWEFKTQDVVDSSPTLNRDGSTVYVGSFDKNMYAIETASGRLRWKFSTTGFIVATPAISPDGSVVYVGSADDYLYAVETGNGTLKWKYLAGSFVLSVRLAVQV